MDLVMWYQYGMGMGNWGFPDHWLGWLVPLAIFDVVLRGVALWRSGREGRKGWFIALLVVHSLGILPGIYLLTHPDKQSHKKKNS